MDEPGSTTILLALAVGMGVMLLGFYGLRMMDPPMWARVLLGGVMLATGLCAMYVWPGILVVVHDPIQFGTTIALMGLGINQLAAPVRRALGKQA